MVLPTLEEPKDVSKNATSIKKCLWEEHVKRYIDKEEALEEGKKKLYMLLWGQCTDVMQTELKSLANFEMFNKDYDPIVLLKAIKSITYSFRDQQKMQVSVWRAMKALFTCYMKDN